MINIYNDHFLSDESVSRFIVDFVELIRVSRNFLHNIYNGYAVTTWYSDIIL